MVEREVEGEEWSQGKRPAWHRMRSGSELDIVSRALSFAMADDSMCSG